jgi:hypothetical protein
MIRARATCIISLVIFDVNIIMQPVKIVPFGFDVWWIVFVLLQLLKHTI